MFALVTSSAAVRVGAPAPRARRVSARCVSSDDGATRRESTRDDATARSRAMGWAPYALRASARAGARAARARGRGDARDGRGNIAARRARGRAGLIFLGDFLVVDVASSSSSTRAGMMTRMARTASSRRRATAGARRRGRATTRKKSIARAIARERAED